MPEIAKSGKFARVWLASDGAPSVGPDSQMAQFEINLRLDRDQALRLMHKLEAMVHGGTKEREQGWMEVQVLAKGFIE